jgi:hypothetical protein
MATSNKRAPIDTTGDPVLEAKWQALVDEVIDAKAAAADARAACIAAERDRGPLHLASEEAHAAVAAAHDAYRAAGKRVEAAAQAIKAGDL